MFFLGFNSGSFEARLEGEVWSTMNADEDVIEEGIF